MQRIIIQTVPEANFRHKGGIVVMSSQLVDVISEGEIFERASLQKSGAVLYWYQ